MRNALFFFIIYSYKHIKNMFYYLYLSCFLFHINLLILILVFYIIILLNNRYLTDILLNTIFLKLLFW